MMIMSNLTKIQLNVSISWLLITSFLISNVKCQRDGIINPQSPSPTKQQPPCGANITLNSQATRIVSPGWDDGEKYPPNTKCVWNFNVLRSLIIERATAIHIRVKHLEVEQDDLCAYDHLDIRGYKKLCGFMINREIVINSSSLVITFRSDSNGEDRGFELELYSHVGDCRPEIIVTEAFGEITSPGFPKEYPLTFDCWTLINANELMKSLGGNGPENFLISLTFEFIGLEPDKRCTYDYVEFFAVDTHSRKSTTSLGKFCDENSLNEAGTTIDHYEDSRVSSFEDKTQPKHYSLKPKFSTKGPYLYIHFVSDDLLNKGGFKVSYKIESDLSRNSLSKCDWKLDQSNTITSPHYPEPYPPNNDCSLTLKSPQTEEKIKLIFESFFMEIDKNCSYDRLEIYDDYVSVQDGSGSSRPIKTLCGHRSSKFEYVSSGPMLRLRFVSDKVNEDKGFAARYEFVKIKTVEAKPIQPPKPIELFTVVPKNASVILGSSHLMQCVPNELSTPPIDPRVEQNKKPKKIFWFQDAKLLSHIKGLSEDGTKLLIHEFSNQDVGRYTCKYGSATADAWLRVQNTDCGVVFTERPQDEVISEGEVNQILKCVPYSSKRPESKFTIKWTKNGKPINSSSVEMLRSGFLAINRPTLEDTGHYFCNVRLQDDPTCISQSGARLDVKRRFNVDNICGKPNLALPSKQKPKTDDSGRIVGGKAAAKGAYPWQVMFWNIDRRSFCGGSLLNEHWIVTAAHCFTQLRGQSRLPPLSSVLVRLGKTDQHQDEEEEIKTRIDLIIKHPNYNPDTFDHDIALLRVKESIPFTDYIKPVCLGTSRSLIDETFFKYELGSFKMGHVTGWGQLEESGGSPRFLQEIKMPIVDQKLCRKASSSLNVTENMFCAGYSQEIVSDACKGDSGGPFVSLSEGRWYLLGIVSWGEGCGRAGKYGYYTKVSNYIDWIRGLISS